MYIQVYTVHANKEKNCRDTRRERKNHFLMRLSLMPTHPYNLIYEGNKSVEKDDEASVIFLAVSKYNFAFCTVVLVVLVIVAVVLL